MEVNALTPMTAPAPPPCAAAFSICYSRGVLHLVKVFTFVLVLLSMLFSLVTCGPCLTAEYDGRCQSYGDDNSVGFQNVIVTDTSSGYDGRATTRISIESVCTNARSFCFPSTLPGFLSDGNKLKADYLGVSKSESDSQSSRGAYQRSKVAGNGSWLSDSGSFELLNGQTVFCSLNSVEGGTKLSSIKMASLSQNDISLCRGPLLITKNSSFRPNLNSELSKLSSFYVSSTAHVEISPPIIDWGHKHLYFPSVAFLTIANTCNDSVLQVYEPFSTNRQFYPCNFSEFLLGPGEVASVCFVFLPRWLGLSTARLILQTSSGGFLIQFKGYAVESPYQISPVLDVDSSSNGRRLLKNLSLFNPFNENLYVREISAWISVSQGNISHHTEAICSLEKFHDSGELSKLNNEDWLVVKGGQVGFSLMSLRLRENWDIGPYGSETVIEMDISFDSEAQVDGALCARLVRSSQEKADTILVPLEIDMDGKVGLNGVAGPVSVYLEAQVPWQSSKIFIAIYLRNGAANVLRIVKISEVAATKVFMMKYIQGLLLFPGTVTRVATVICNQVLGELHDSTSVISNENKNCKLSVLTNDSTTPQIEIPCQNIIRICLRHQRDLSNGPCPHSENTESGNGTGSWDSSTHLPSEIKALETVEGDEFVLENWKSQGVMSSVSVLDDHELLFPVVQVGTQHSKWITVKNPSEQPVIMQLILNSGELVDECRGTDGPIKPLSLGTSAHNEFTGSGSGFSIPESAQTEAYVHPHGNASFGPIFFHPLSRCGWTSSALIRNNLSGVEWLSLRGFGGSSSLVLLDGSEPVRSIQFNLNLPFPLNISPPDLLSQTEDTTYACSQPLSKELYVKNMGDLPLEVERIEVSGTECGLDGFMVHTCYGFSLEPGESMKLLISYRSDFYSAVLHRDLELALAGGILVVPMKASLPLYMFHLCRKSVFWMRLKKFGSALLLSAFLIFLIFCCIFSPLINFGSYDYVYKSAKRPITAVRSPRKSTRLHHNQTNSNCSMSREMDGLLRSVAEGKTSNTGFNNQDCQLGGPDQGAVAEQGKPTSENHKKVLSSLSKSVVVDNPSALEGTQHCNLTVRIGKEKGKRRRKKKGLTGFFEVSSSQSGNSTPSSPLSPGTSSTPNRTWSPSHDTDSINARSVFVQGSDQQSRSSQAGEPTSGPTIIEPKYCLNPCSNNSFSANPEQPLLPRKTHDKPVLLLSAAFPSSRKLASDAPSSTPQPASTHTVAPHVRAPGPNLYNQKKVTEKVGDEYTYSIWGGRFSGLHLVDSSHVLPMKSVAAENTSESFFVRGPQALVTKSQPKSVSYIHEEG